MPKRIDYRQELNPAQYEAVTSTEGPYLVIAGAGSGKTRVLTYRTAYLIEQGVHPSQVLLLTFTRRASQEMLHRAAAILDDRCRGVTGGTFHAFANNVLRRYGRPLGLNPGFIIMDQADAENAVQSLRTRLGLDKLDRRFPKKKTLLSILSSSVNRAEDLETVLCKDYPHFLDWLGEIRQLQEEYEAAKRRQSLMDFDDLLLFLRDLLRDHPPVREELSAACRYIMVDEYQDTNVVQADIVELLASEHQNVMAVGDDAQSIYSFRGANYKNIMRFPRMFPQTRTIMLEQNYRSAQPILDLTNQLIRSAAEKYDKNLFSEKSGSQLPVYVDVANENAQSQYVVARINQLLREGVPAREIAVLFRSGWHSNDLEVELAGWGIPFAKYGGQKFVEAAHVKDMISFLRVVAHPYHEMSWLRVLNLLRGVGPQTALRVVKEIMAQQKGCGPDLSRLKPKENVTRLLDGLKKLDPQHQGPAELLEHLMGLYYPLMTETYDDHDKRINDLDSLQRIAQRYDSLEAFLADMALDPLEKSTVDRQGSGAPGGKSPVVLSTIHSAKGLEWHTVFIIFVADGYLPSYQSLSSEEDIEEERRLLYVAMTRAKENLFLLRPQVDRPLRMGLDQGGYIYTRVSRFLMENGLLQRFARVESEHGPCVPLI